LSAGSGGIFAARLVVEKRAYRFVRDGAKMPREPAGWKPISVNLRNGRWELGLIGG
jgi:hypothetical protein